MQLQGMVLPQSAPAISTLDSPCVISGAAHTRRVNPGSQYLYFDDDGHNQGEDDPRAESRPKRAAPTPARSQASAAFRFLDARLARAALVDERARAIPPSGRRVGRPGRPAVTTTPGPLTRPLGKCNSCSLRGPRCSGVP